MAYKTPTLPKITKIELVGYQPLFNETIRSEIKHNRFLVLGGNGLGKTTIMQSIVYCIAGEADLEIEPVKGKRWGRRYFYGRIAKPENAYVEVECYLGDNKVRLKRGFQSKRLLAFTLNDAPVSVYQDAEKDFELFLTKNIGYRILNDFRYIIHKLCYLPEDRPNLAWDSEGQIRLFMILFSDLMDEAEFREKREQLKELDSKRRHINVAINKAEMSLHTLYRIDDSYTDEQEDVEPDTAEEGNTKNWQHELTLSLKELNNVSSKKVPLQQEASHIKKRLSVLTSEIEDLQSQLAQIEEAFIFHQLNLFESKEVNLALHKLIHRQICPACGTKAEKLGKTAQEFSQRNRCPLCGTLHSSSDTKDTKNLPLLDAQLSDRIRERLSLEQKLIGIEKKLELLLKEEQTLQFKYDKIRLKQPIMSSDCEIKPQEQSSLKSELTDLKQYYQETEHSFDRLKVELEKKYEEFKMITTERITRLGELYENYAYSFLGISCQLDTREADIKFLTLSLFVPKFGGQVRAKSESCSEAQRFFLDIAFRMAMIDLAKELSRTEGVFICETPESALDIAYVDNVADMFMIFSKEGHTLIATGNLQPGGLAGPILADDSKQMRRESILNLIDYGRLSDVQNRNLPALKKQFENILNYKKS